MSQRGNVHLPVLPPDFEWRLDVRIGGCQVRRELRGRCASTFRQGVPMTDTVIVSATELRAITQCCEIATHEQAWPGSAYKRICDRHLAKMQHLAGVRRRADEPEAA